MLNFFIGFAFFEFGALCGFFVAALMQAARDGDECAGRSRAENIQYCGVHHEADRPDGSERRTALQQYQSKLLADKSSGKQSVRMLLRQNRGVSSVEINKTGIRDFERYAKKYGIDYAIRKDSSEVPPRYLVFFKAPDVEAFNAAFKEYSASLLSKTMRPSVLEKLHELVQAAAELPGKVRRKEQERGL